MLTKLKITVDRSSCIACGLAPNLCSEVFVRGEGNGKNRITDKYSTQTSSETSIGIVPGELYECVKAAVEACPVKLIDIEEIKE